MTRGSLHKLSDKLPETDLQSAVRVPEALRAKADPTSQALDHATVDDEAETAEEAAAVTAAWQERRRGEGLTTAEVRGKLGLA